MDNFKEIRDIFIREKAAIEVDSPQSLEYELRKLLSSLSERKALGGRAKSLLEKNRGAASRTFNEVKAVIKR
jgi:3-deoxy-D-manno-octulosonic-acid transferase